MRVPFHAVAAATSSSRIDLVPASAVKPYASLPRGHQRILQSLRRTLERGAAAASSSEALVACAVSSGGIDVEDDSTSPSSSVPPSMSSSSLMPCHRMTWTTGVNYALHRALLREAEERSCALRPSTQSQANCCCAECCGPLKGLLKGCAEQNALGSFAAQGQAYQAIRHVFLHSACRRTGPPTDVLRNNAGAAALVRTPCPECWGHLCTITERVQRATAGTATVTLHLVIEPSPELRRDTHVPFVWDSSLLCRTLSAGKVAPAIQFIASDARPPEIG